MTLGNYASSKPFFFFFVSTRIARKSFECAIFLEKKKKRNIESRTKDKIFFPVIIFSTREYFSLVWFLCPLRRRKVQRF
jgi:hypothetical protein